jgi:hypothetical protein
VGHWGGTLGILLAPGPATDDNGCKRSESMSTTLLSSAPNSSSVSLLVRMGTIFMACDQWLVSGVSSSVIGRGKRTLFNKSYLKLGLGLFD